MWNISIDFWNVTLGFFPFVCLFVCFYFKPVCEEWLCSCGSIISWSKSMRKSLQSVNSRFYQVVSDISNYILLAIKFMCLTLEEYFYGLHKFTYFKCLTFNFVHDLLFCVLIYSCLECVGHILELSQLLLYFLRIVKC